MSYAEDFSDITNPERGFFYQSESSGLETDRLKDFEFITIASEKITVIRRLYNLGKFREADISTQFLTYLESDFAIARTKGLKFNLRFAYSFLSTDPQADAPEPRIISHIAQLGPFLKANADVISHVDAGFIGRYGEWYESTYSNDNTESRRRVLAALHAALPIFRAVVVRTPRYKRDMFRRQSAIAPAEAFSGSEIARTGHLNDCFLASADDVGTYAPPDAQSIAEQRAYVASETRYLPMSGETCGQNPPRSECGSTEAEMALLHWSGLNIQDGKGVLDSWKRDLCFERIRLRLGYRFVLLDANLPSKLQPGGRLQGNIRLKNVGFASPFNSRGLELILRVIATGVVRRIAIPADPRRFSPDENGGISEIKLDLPLPDDLALAKYEILLALPDPMSSLRDNPAYSIRLANTDVWEPSTGFNKLGLTADVIAPVRLLSVSSRKLHGATPFLLPIDHKIPIDGPVSVEPRALGTGHTLVFRFDSPVTSVGAVTVLDGLQQPIGNVSIAKSGNDVILSLTKASDNQRLTVTVNGVNDTGSASASLGFLLGDVNNTREVSASDVSAVKARSGQASTPSNFQYDVDASGRVTASDIAAVKARSAMTLR